MITETGGFAVVQDSNVTGTNEPPLALQKGRAAAGGEIVAVAVAIRAGDFFGASHADFVGAVGATTALAPVDEQIIKPAVTRQARRLDGRIPGQLVKRCIGAD